LLGLFDQIGQQTLPLLALAQGLLRLLALGNVNGKDGCTQQLTGLRVVDGVDAVYETHVLALVLEMGGLRRSHDLDDDPSPFARNRLGNQLVDVLANHCLG